LEFHSGCKADLIIWWSVVLKNLIRQSSPNSRHFLFLRSKCSQHPILKHLHFITSVGFWRWLISINRSVFLDFVHRLVSWSFWGVLSSLSIICFGFGTPDDEQSP
jgi:hypothetical protein